MPQGKESETISRKQIDYNGGGEQKQLGLVEKMSHTPVHICIIFLCAVNIELTIEVQSFLAIKKKKKQEI